MAKLEKEPEMIKESMTCEERFFTTVKLGVPDRVPVSSMLDEFALKQKGITPQQRLKPEFQDKVLQAFHEIYDDLGGYDFLWHAGTSFPYGSWRGSCDMMVNATPPGQDNNFTAEKPVLMFEDYDKIISRGWNGFCEELYPRLTGQSIEQIQAKQEQAIQAYREDIAWWMARGVPVHQGGASSNPEVLLSLGRTLYNFTLDMHRHPEKILAVMDAMVDDLIQNTIEGARATGIPWAHLLLPRGSATFYNLKVFEKFVFPYMKKIVTAYTKSDLFVNMHCDTNWILNLPYFKEFPRGRCLVELDSTTDIFRAKEILGGHMCIKGDVPAPLMTLGRPDEVTEYCRKVIERVGKGGGLVLSTGCCCPVDAKFENVKAMIEAAKTIPASA
jgi:hypothetical protein